MRFSVTLPSLAAVCIVASLCATSSAAEFKNDRDRVRQLANTVATGEWTEPDKIPAVFRPFLGWADMPPSMGIFAVALIGLMFMAPFGIVGLWRQTIARFVTVVPRPAGTSNVKDLDSATAES